jgi:hypothetical protein
MAPVTPKVLVSSSTACVMAYRRLPFSPDPTMSSARWSTVNVEGRFLSSRASRRRVKGRRTDAVFFRGWGW